MSEASRDRSPKIRAGALALPAGALRRLPGLRLAAGLSAPWDGLKAAIATEAERRRLFNWLPVMLGLGILLYFVADREPALWAPVLGCCLSGGLAWLLLRRRVWAAIICAAVAAVFAGFAAAAWRTASVAAPALERTRFGAVSGFVESLEARAGGVRLVLLVTDMPGVEPQRRPQRVRVSTPVTTLRPGDHILATARLLPPPGPARPGGYDFGRDAFFRGLGAVGSLIGKVTLTPPPEPAPSWLRWRAGVDTARNALTERIVAIAGGQAGAMAAALVTGKRGLITEATNEDLRAAGIYHIVSISGLHMVLAAGTIFWAVRALLALSQTLALLWPVKKLAAIAAMLGATAYCVFSGAEVATVRSLLMTLVMLGAILVDRPALSMRNLAIAATIVLLREPEALLGPSFQMSFGAVAALIAFAEFWQRRPATPLVLPWPLRLISSGALGIVLTTLVATAATAPFGAYHFQSFNPFGLLGNALALPFVSLIVMPAAAFGVLAYPFGLDWLAWSVMGWASGLVLGLAHWVAGLERSTLAVPAFGPAALACLAASLLWLTLWTTALRGLALVPLIAGVALAMHPARPDVLIERDGSGLLVRGPEGKLVLAGRPSRFVLAQWLSADGDSRTPDDPSLRRGAACDSLGCVVTAAGGRRIAWARERLAIIEDCLRADLVVTPIPWDAPCRAELVDRRRLSGEGATSLYATAQGWRRFGAADPAVERPWTRNPRPAAQAPAAAAAGAPPPDDPDTEPPQ